MTKLISRTLVAFAAALTLISSAHAGERQTTDLAPFPLKEAHRVPWSWELVISAPVELRLFARRQYMREACLNALIGAHAGYEKGYGAMCIDSFTGEVIDLKTAREMAAKLR